MIGNDKQKPSHVSPLTLKKLQDLDRDLKSLKQKVGHIEAEKTILVRRILELENDWDEIFGKIEDAVGGTAEVDLKTGKVTGSIIVLPTSKE